MEDNESLHAKYLRLRTAFKYPECRQLTVKDLANCLRLINELAKSYFLAPNLQDGIDQFLRLNNYTTEELFDIGYQLIDVHLDWVAMPYLLRAFESDNSARIMSEMICAFEGFGYHRQVAELCARYPGVCAQNAFITYMWGFDSIHAGLLRQAAAVLDKLTAFGAEANQLTPQLEGFVQRARVLYPTAEVIDQGSVRTWNFILNASLLLEVNSVNDGYFPLLHDSTQSLQLFARSILKMKSVWDKSGLSHKIKKIFYAPHALNGNLIFTRVLSAVLKIPEVAELSDEHEHESGLFVCYSPSYMTQHHVQMMQNRNPNQIWWAHQVSTSNLQFSYTPISPDIIGLISFYHDMPFESQIPVENQVADVLKLLDDPMIIKSAIDPEFDEIVAKTLTLRNNHGLLLLRDELCRRTRFRSQPVSYESIQMSDDIVIKEARKSFEKKEYEWANHLVCRYLDRHPNDITALFLQYEIYSEMEETLHTDSLTAIRDKQLEKIQQLLQSDIVNDSIFTGKIEHSIGMANFKQKKFFESETHLKKATEVDPNNNKYQFSLATLYAANGLIGEASEIVEKFQNEELFAQLRTHLDAIMNGVNNHTSGADSTNNEGESINSAEEDEELSGVKATILYDNNAIMLGTSQDDGLFIHPYWLYNFGMPDAAVTVRRLLDFMTVFKWPINCVIVSDLAALPVGLTIAAKFNLVLKSTSNVNRNDVPLYVTFVWDSSSAGFALKKIRTKCSTVYSFSMARLSNDGFSIADIIGIVTPSASSRFCWTPDDDWTDYLELSAPPMIPEKKIESQEVESEEISSFFPQTLHNAYSDLYHQAMEHFEANVEEQIDCYYSSKHLRPHLKPKGERVHLIKEKKYGSIEEKIVDKLKHLTNDEHKIDGSLLKEIEENIATHPNILTVLKKCARETPNASILKLILEHDFDTEFIRDILLENPSSNGAKSLILLVHQRKEMLDIIMSTIRNMLEDNAQQSGFFMEKLFTKLDPTIFEPWADELLKIVKNTLKDASDMENYGFWTGRAIEALAYLRPTETLELLEHSIMPVAQTIDELSYAIEQLLTGAANAIVIASRQFPLEKETNLIRHLIHDVILKQPISTPYLKLLIFTLDYGFIDETLADDFKAVQEHAFTHLSTAVDAHSAKKLTLLVQAGKLPQDMVINFTREFLQSTKHVPQEMLALLVRYATAEDESLLLKYARAAKYLPALGLIKLGHERFKRVISDAIDKFSNKEAYGQCLTCVLEVGGKDHLDIFFDQLPRTDKWPMLAKTLVVLHEYLAAEPHFMTRWSQLSIELKHSLVHEALQFSKTRGALNFMYRLEPQTVMDWADKLDLDVDQALSIQFLNFLSHHSSDIPRTWIESSLNRVLAASRDFVLQTRALYQLAHPLVKFDNHPRSDDA